LKKTLGFDLTSADDSNREESLDFDLKKPGFYESAKPVTLCYSPFINQIIYGLYNITLDYLFLQIKQSHRILCEIDHN